MSHIRAAHESEKNQISQLWSDSGLGITSDAEWEAISEGLSTQVLVSEENGVVLGAAVTAFDGWRAYIYHVAVAADQRGRGLAQQLMAEGEEHLRARGASRVYLLVNQDNTAGLALSASMGYEPEGDIAFVKEVAPVLMAATA